MAIAGDVKSIFRYLFTNSLVNNELVKKLQDIDYCRNNFASVKYPVLLKVDHSKSHQDQRKYNTPQARYYGPENFLITYKDENYFFTSQLFEEQRRHYYSWLEKIFSIKAADIIQTVQVDLIEEVKDYIERGFRQDVLDSETFVHEYAREAFNDWKGRSVL